MGFQKNVFETNKDASWCEEDEDKDEEEDEALFTI